VNQHVDALERRQGDDNVEVQSSEVKGIKKREVQTVGVHPGDEIGVTAPALGRWREEAQTRNGGGRAGVWHHPVVQNTGHPTSKPLPLVSDWVCLFTDYGDTVCDPFMGGGTTGEACAGTGRKFIGIERERRYFDLSCERISRAQAQGQLLPHDPPAAPEQVGLALEP